MTKVALLYEGKGKKIFATRDHDKVIQQFKDSLTALNGKKQGSFDGKGKINLAISTLIFKYLHANGILSHFIEKISDDEMLVTRVAIIPLEVVVRNRVAGSLEKRLGLKEGEALLPPLIEFFYKSDKLNDPMVTEAHIQLVKLATPDEVLVLKEMALKINRVLIPMFADAGMSLVDFKVEFGKTPRGEIILADEISPDCCRLWDAKTSEKLDKDRFRQDLGKIEEGYKTILERLTQSHAQAQAKGL